MFHPGRQAVSVRGAMSLRRDSPWLALTVLTAISTVGLHRPHRDERAGGADQSRIPPERHASRADDRARLLGPQRHARDRRRALCRARAAVVAGRAGHAAVVARDRRVRAGDGLRPAAARPHRRRRGRGGRAAGGAIGAGRLLPARTPRDGDERVPARAAGRRVPRRRPGAAGWRRNGAGARRSTSLRCPAACSRWPRGVRRRAAARATRRRGERRGAVDRRGARRLLG